MISLLLYYFSSGEALVRRARKIHRAGRPSKALETVDLALAKLDKKTAGMPHVESSLGCTIGEAWLLRGHILHGLERPSAAAESFLVAFRLRRSDSKSLRFLAMRLLRAEDLGTEAKQVYLELIGHAGNDGNGRLARIEALSAPDWSDAATWETARRWNVEVAARRADLAWPQRYLGRLALLRQDWDAAATALTRACRRGDERPRMRHWLAYAQWRQGRLESARAHLDAAITEEPRLESFLLRGHVLRALGEPDAAARDYSRSRASDRWTSTTAFAHAEVLLNSGQATVAAELLDALEEQADPRWLLLRSAVDRSRERWQAALQGLRRIPRASGVWVSARTSIVSIAALHPRTPGAITALNVVPAGQRDDHYWLARGNVRVVQRKHDKALACWQRVSQPTHPRLGQARTALVRRHLAKLYNSGEDEAVLETAKTEMAHSGGDAEIGEVVASALIRRCLAIAVEDEGSARALVLAEQAESWFPAARRPLRIPLLRALLHAELGQHLEARDVFSSLPAAVRGAEAVLQRARGTLYLGNSGECARSLEALPVRGERSGRVALALAAAAGSWETASELLQHLSERAEHMPFRAAVLLRMGRGSELLSLPGDYGGVRYLQAVERLRQGNFAEAERLLRAFDEDDSLRVPARRLLGWQRLRQLRESLAAGDRQKALDRLVKIVELWPEVIGSADGLAADHLARLFLLTELRGKVLTVLEEQAAMAGPGEPASAHQLAVFHLAEGTRIARSGDVGLALSHWEQSVAYLGVTLSSFAYVQEWAGERRREYGVPLEAEAVVGIESRVLRHYQSVFGEWSERMAGNGPTAESERLSDLALLLRAELRGAQRLRELGGFTPRDGSPGSELSAGALYIALQGLEEPFGRFLSELSVKSSGSAPDDSPLGMLQRLMEMFEDSEDEDESAVEPEVKEDLQKLFSPLRLAWMLENDGHPAQALRRIQELEDSARTMPRALACNPAFAASDSRDEYSQLVTRYRVALLLRLGERDVASGPERLKPGLASWSEALSRAVAIGEKDQIAEAIREKALGRSHVLLERDRSDEALKLLAAVNKLCGGDRVKGLLATLYANRGIEAANADRPQKAVTDLRRARKLNRHSTHISSQLAMALTMRSRELTEEDPRRSLRLIQEAAKLADEAVKADPYNKELQQLAQGIKLELTMKGLTSDEVSPLDFMQMMMQGDPEHARRMSTRHHNLGVRLMEQGDLGEGIDELEKALDLEPASRETKGMLAQALAMDAERQLEHHPGKALERLERAVELDPDNQAIKLRYMLLQMTQSG